MTRTFEQHSCNSTTFNRFEKLMGVLMLEANEQRNETEENKKAAEKQLTLKCSTIPNEY